MIERLEYDFKNTPDYTGVELNLNAPKGLVDFVTASGGPMLEEIKASDLGRVLTRKHDGQGGIQLNIHPQQPKKGYGGDPGQRANHTMNMLVQLDTAAAKQGLSDPRFTIAPIDIYEGDPLNYFQMSFARPEGSPDQVLGKLQENMLRAATSLFLYTTQATKGRDKHLLLVERADDGTLTIKTEGPNAHPLLSTVTEDPLENAERITLIGSPAQHPYYVDSKTAHARLVAVVGAAMSLDKQ